MEEGEWEEGGKRSRKGADGEKGAKMQRCKRQRKRGTARKGMGMEMRG